MIINLVIFLFLITADGHGILPIHVIYFLGVDTLSLNKFNTGLWYFKVETNPFYIAIALKREICGAFRAY